MNNTMWKMRQKFQNTLREYLSKIKNPTTMLILSGCKRQLKTAKSFSVGRNRTRNVPRGNRHVREEEEEQKQDISAKLSDVDRFLAENFKSLYAAEEDEEEAGSEEADVAAEHECVAVLTCSPDPVAELRRSMKGMLESRARKRQSVDWVFMEEILMCYLALNEKRSRGFVLGAFVDLVVELRSSSSSHRVPRKVTFE